MPTLQGPPSRPRSELPRCSWVVVLMLSACSSEGSSGGGASSMAGVPAVGGASGNTAGASGMTSPPSGGGGAGAPAGGASGSAAGKPAPSPAAGSGTAGAPPSAGSPAAGSGEVAANAWSMMGADARNWYTNTAEKQLSVANAPMLKEQWRFPVAGWPPGSPAIAEGKVFVMATGGTYGIELASGKMLWARTDLPGTA